MILDEAIEDFRYDAEQNMADLDISFAKRNNQIADWLEDYKRLCTEKEQVIYERAYKDGYDKGYSDGRFAGYNKAIDDFVKSEDHLMKKIKEEKAEVSIDYEWRKVVCLDDIRIMLHQGLLETAEQLRKGAVND